MGFWGVVGQAGSVERWGHVDRGGGRQEVWDGGLEGVSQGLWDKGPGMWGQDVGP